MNNLSLFYFSQSFNCCLAGVFFFLFSSLSNDVWTILEERTSWRGLGSFFWPEVTLFQCRPWWEGKIEIETYLVMQINAIHKVIG